MNFKVDQQKSSNLNNKEIKIGKTNEQTNKKTYNLSPKIEPTKKNIFEEIMVKQTSNLVKDMNLHI